MYIRRREELLREIDDLYLETNGEFFYRETGHWALKHSVWYWLQQSKQHLIDSLAPNKESLIAEIDDTRIGSDANFIHVETGLVATNEYVLDLLHRIRTALSEKNPPA